MTAASPASPTAVEEGRVRALTHVESSIPAWSLAALAVIIALFLTLAVAYAHYTPPWQAPDEPAHYNYIQALAHGQLPILQAGDYPAKLVPLAPATRVSDLTPFRYESHQPPLFYALEAPVDLLTGGRLLPLRAVSILFGALLLPVVFASARLAVPGAPWLWLGATAFAAFIPMSLFIDAAIENDSLANLVVSLLLLVYLALVRGWKSRWRWPLLGLLLAAAALTKATIYIPAGLLVLACWWLAARQGGSRELWRAAWQTAVVAVAVAGWWFIRNGLTYGWLDLAAQGRQKEVAAGQLQTGGLAHLDLSHFVVTSFDSFWGQFGWMTIPLPQRDYKLLLVFVALAALGWLAGMAVRRWHTDGPIVSGLILTVLGVLAGYVYYNLTFVQPQGRYLFPALVPIGLFVAGGLAAPVPKRLVPVVTGALSLGMLAFAVLALRHDLIPSFAA